MSDPIVQLTEEIQVIKIESTEVCVQGPPGPPGASGFTTHIDSTSNPHSVTAVQVGADASGTAAGLIATHEAASNPHPGYLTPAEGDVAYAALGHNHSGVYDPSGTAASAVSTHEAGSSVHAIAGVTGLQTALDGKSATTHNHDAAYAPIAKGVTNGDAHDHNSGDGAQIAYSGLSGLPTLGTAAAASTGDFEASGAVATHAALTQAHGISAFGATLVDDTDASAARTTLGLGSAATTSSTAYATAAQGSTADSALQINTPISINAQTGTTYTLVLSDAGKLIELSNTSAITLTIPLNSSVAFPVGTQIALQQKSTGQVTVSPAGGVTMNSRLSYNKLSRQYAGAALIKKATDTWWLEGAIA